MPLRVRIIILLINMELSPNPGKNLIIDVNGRKYARYPLRTHVLGPSDNIVETVERYVKEYLQKGDTVFMGERSVAATQGRTYPIDQVKPSRLAFFLVKFVTKSPYGIGLGSPQTMQLAIEEVGIPRLLLAGFVALLTKPFGIKGLFYTIAGPQAKAIDGAASYVIPPYNTHVTKAPLHPYKVAQEVSDRIGAPFAIVDACDIGAWIVGVSRGVNKGAIIGALKDNPLGQSKEQTPIGILREVPD